MDIKQIDLAAELVFQMFKEHPELCPHVYEWFESTAKYIDNKKIKTTKYKCKICGYEMTETEEYVI